MANTAMVAATGAGSLPPDLPPAGSYCIDWILFSIVTTAVVTRLVYRWPAWFRLTETIQSADDYLVLFSFVLLFIHSVLNSITTPESYELRRTRTNPTEYAKQTTNETNATYGRIQFAMKILYYTILWAVKLSFLMYLRPYIMRTKTRIPSYMSYWWTITCFWAVGFVAVHLSCFMGCSKINVFTIKVFCGTDDDTNIHFIGVLYATILDLFTSFLILALALLMLKYNSILATHRTTKQSLAIASLAFLFLFTVIICIVRQINVSENHTLNFDRIWVEMWNTIESHVAVLMSAIPGLVTASCSNPIQRIVKKPSIQIIHNSLRTSTGPSELTHKVSMASMKANGGGGFGFGTVEEEEEEEEDIRAQVIRIGFTTEEAPISPNKELTGDVEAEAGLIKIGFTEAEINARNMPPPGFF